MRFNAQKGQIYVNFVFIAMVTFDGIWCILKQKWYTQKLLDYQHNVPPACSMWIGSIIMIWVLSWNCLSFSSSVLYGNRWITYCEDFIVPDKSGECFSRHRLWAFVYVEFWRSLLFCLQLDIISFIINFMIKKKLCIFVPGNEPIPLFNHITTWNWTKTYKLGRRPEEIAISFF